MTKRSTIVRSDLLELAIETVIQDTRIPKDLRTALAAYRNQRAFLNSHGIRVVPPKTTRLSNRPDNSGSNVGDPGCTDLARKIDVQMWIDVESLDWSLWINGHLHEHITLEILEDLIDYTVVASVLSITKTFSPRPQ
jgi:hypothetical protein